jgi:hypothetical protein
MGVDVSVVSDDSCWLPSNNKRYCLLAHSLVPLMRCGVVGCDVIGRGLCVCVYVSRRLLADVGGRSWIGP